MIYVFREEREEEYVGDELVVRKMIYTKNPFPFIVRKTLIRPEELVWYEELRVNKKKRTACFWYVFNEYTCWSCCQACGWASCSVFVQDMQ